MTHYSGRTTALQHKKDDWEAYDGPIPVAVRMERIFSCQWTDCPVEVEAEVKRLWREAELGNDHCYYSWSSTEEYWHEGMNEEITHAERFPLIDEYLRKYGIIKCLIHWWW